MKKLRDKMDALMVKAATKMDALMSKKVKGIDGFIVVIIIIVVAIVVGAVFRDQITAFITNFFGQFATKTAELFGTSGS